MLRLSNSILQSKGFTIVNSQLRYLFSWEELGIEGYKHARTDVENLVANHSDYKKNFRKHFIDNQCDMVKYENKLKDLIYMINKNSDDIRILKGALNTLVQKRKGYMGKKYCFSTVIMRAFHYLNMPVEAIKFFDDKIIGQLFTDNIGHQVLLDMLYENKKYDDVLRVYESLDKRGHLRGNNRRHLDVIVLATYYRLNTPEALKQAYALWKEMQSNGSHQYRKSRTFVAGLAIKQNEPQLALDIIEDEEQQLYVNNRHILLLAWAQLQRYTDIIEMLKYLFEIHKNDGKSYTTSIQVLQVIEELFTGKQDEEISDREIAEFISIRESIELENLVTKKTFDELICAPFSTKPSRNIYFKLKG
ncbi:pentatricopeptide repeat-containing protein 2, mitochondrial-like [Contarinia nasturtii]|uniref:pentatricopeptide repeat-containing protein 2, mitochondrial-like n=1 Tax=Contarinia nasturtii TaxID=265458 RepID=UPI0012D3DB61|nr:pentatricopeptide repeat-containing protein 2, mitochondrial-like [Contarinia nasturtii]